jgi:hypothetical protein
MAKELKTAKEHQRDEISDVKAVGGGIEPGVHRHRPLTQAVAEGIDIGCVVDQTSCGKIIKDVGGTHRGSLSPVFVN